MHIPTEQFERVPIYMLSPTPSPPNEKTAGELFNWSKVETSSDAGGGASGGDSHSHSHKDTSESENEGESKSLPPKITFPRNRISSRIVRMLTLHHDSHLGDGQQQQQQQPSPGHSGPLVKVCRDCKTLVRHLIDTGRTNFGAGIQKQAK